MLMRILVYSKTYNLKCSLGNNMAWRPKNRAKAKIIFASGVSHR